ncbi:hypothetical protein [Tahibacter amnicola]|uniref:Uncharacterized protein n=1 Tax=Tahibacter amnicola TaxID=2976241 RepID=A0ABY6BL12_9GAMM|nr:hypothetical protein [Tahibacter amnicola]UXI70162.1 hypothetical protein N4264_11180 [Tahibacter amnicola]
MHSIRRILAAAVLAVVGMSDTAFASAEDATMRPAADIAQAALNELGLSLAPLEGSLPVGFPFAVSDVQDLRRATVGFGYEEWQADPQLLLAGRSLADAARPTGQWRYVVSVDDSPVGLLTLAMQDGRWSIVSIGGAALSEEVAQIARSTKADAVRFVRVPQASSDFIELRGVDRRVSYVPLGGARRMLGLDKAGALDESAFAVPLRDVIARNLSQ